MREFITQACMHACMPRGREVREVIIGMSHGRFGLGMCMSWDATHPNKPRGREGGVRGHCMHGCTDAPDLGDGM